MRRFYSYGPVNERFHFTVKRKNLVTHCFKNIIGDPGEGGHYFTIWAARQTGKTWLMRQVKKRIKAEYGDRFSILNFSTGVLRGLEFKVSKESAKLPEPFSSLLNEKFPGNPNIKTWRDFREMFSIEKGLWDKPLIMFIDEIDTVSSEFMDILAGQFRELYLDKPDNLLHGLALIGVHAVLGVDSKSGSPFNIQKSLRVPNLTWEEVKELYDQYQEESGQKIDPVVVEKVYETTRGQPGLVSWFGELLTEKYNPGIDKTINKTVWRRVYQAALHMEWNNTVLNLIKKAGGAYLRYVLDLFGKPNMLFSIRTDWCSYLYLNGIIDGQEVISPDGRERYVCRFSSPYVQECLYNALSYDLVDDRLPILALDPLDELADVFGNKELNPPALLERYKDYLKRLKAKGLNPWKDQPRRSDLHLTEAVGHFHLYSWFMQAVDDYCIISPEFPTGNGKVDLHLKCGEKRGIIEVKSYKSMAKVKEAKTQAAKYAEQTGLDSVTIALFVPVEDDEILAKLSGRDIIKNVKVNVCAIGWV